MLIYLSWILFGSIMLQLSIRDIKTHIVTNQSCLIVAIFSIIPIALHCMTPKVNILQVLISHIGGALGIFIVMLLTSMWTKGGMGGGDVKLMAAIALWFSFTNSLILLVSSCFTFSLYVAFLNIRNKNKENKIKKTVPYVPFIFVGILVIGVKEIILNI